MHSARSRSENVRPPLSRDAFSMLVAHLVAHPVAHSNAKLKGDGILCVPGQHTRRMSFSSRPIPHVISAHTLSPACDHGLSRSLPVLSSARYSRELIRISSRTFTYNAVAFGACNIFLAVYFVLETIGAVPRKDAQTAAG